LFYIYPHKYFHCLTLSLSHVLTLSHMWCVIVNQITCKNGWKKWISFLEENSIMHTRHHTRSLDEVRQVIETAYRTGNRRFLFVGGDGTVHHGVNILLTVSGNESREIIMGVLPCGTGNDWVRTFGISKKQLAIGLKEEYTAPMNVMKATWPDGRVHYGINMVGGALDASVVALLKKAPIKIPSYIIYPYGLFRALLKPHTWKGKIRIDGHEENGTWLTIQAGFGKYCGGGMYVLPHAREDSPGLLLMKPKSLFRILISTPDIYNGKIIHDKRAFTYHFTRIEIEHMDKPIPMEADGEWMGWSPVKLEACFDVMRRIV
jgi:diacylglycerol kinase family enzyme